MEKDQQIQNGREKEYPGDPQLLIGIKRISSRDLKP
jgi:hypothetical protein